MSAPTTSKAVTFSGSTHKLEGPTKRVWKIQLRSSKSEREEFMSEMRKYLKIKDSVYTRVYRYLDEDEFSMQNIMTHRQLEARALKFHDKFCSQFGMPDSRIPIFIMAGKLLIKKRYRDSFKLHLIASQLYTKHHDQALAASQIASACDFIGICIRRMHIFRKENFEILKHQYVPWMVRLRESIGNLKNLSRLDRVIAQGKCYYWIADTYKTMRDLHAFRLAVFGGVDLIEGNLTLEELLRWKSNTYYYDELKTWRSAYD